MATNISANRKTERDDERAQFAATLTQCACFNFRKASRLVTKLYDEALAPAGIRSTQFVVLVTCFTLPDININRLADELVMDRSTLTRNLRPLVEQGWLDVTPGADRRTRIVRITAAGKKAMLSAVPHYVRVQTSFVTTVGEKRWQTVLKQLNATVDAVAKI